MKINVNLRPSGGYVFKNSDGSMHRGGNWPIVIQKVIGYRQRHGQSIGNVEEEVMAQACERYPGLCKPEAQNILPGGKGNIKRPSQTVSIRTPPLKSRVLLWLAHLFSARIRGQIFGYVLADEAAARESICAACPQNQPLGGSGCSSCKKALSDYRDVTIPNLRRFERLGGCVILGVDLVTSVHLDEIRVDNPSLPMNCWRKMAI